MFDSAHAFHRQLYDIWGGYGLTWWQRDSAVARALRYYLSRKDLAFSTRPKSMDLMEGQPYSLAFRRQDPKFNGLLWSYHWLQMSLYDALIEGRSERELQAAVDAKVATFFRMLDSAPAHMPTEMPMSPGSAPLFTDVSRRGDRVRQSALAARRRLGHSGIELIRARVQQARRHLLGGFGNLSRRYDWCDQRRPVEGDGSDDDATRALTPHAGRPRTAGMRRTHHAIVTGP